ncbi:radical SAM superfamily protein, partial [Vibrio parahaemolyticus IDH02640]
HCASKMATARTA